jgi:hypothetical protein
MKKLSLIKLLVLVLLTSSIFYSAVGLLSGTRADAATVWSNLGLPSGLNLTGGIYCVSTNTCFAVGANISSGNSVGDIFTTNNGGATWSQDAVLANTGMVSSIFCTSSSNCVAAAFDPSFSYTIILRSTNGGISWDPVTTINLGSTITVLPATVACYSPTCIIPLDVYDSSNGNSGVSFAYSSNSGGNWALSAAVNSQVGVIYSASCFSASACEAAGSNSQGSTGYIIGTTNGGSTWSVQNSNSSVNQYDSINCPATNICYATADFFNQSTGQDNGSIYYSSTGGASWSSLSAPNGFGVAEIWCINATTCYTSGQSNSASAAQVFDTSNSGSTWNIDNIPSGVFAQTITCLSVGICYDFEQGTSSVYLLTNATSTGVPAVTGLSSSSGPVSGGQVIQVQGYNFSGTTAVDFGSTPATNINLVSGTDLQVTVPANSAGQVDVTVTNAQGTSTKNSSDLYNYIPANPYTPVNPFRICDTRSTSSSNQCNTSGQGTLSEGGSLNVQITGVDSVPSTATAAVLNVTVTNTTASGYLTLSPGGSETPLSSNLNWQAGETRANLVTMTLGYSGNVSVFNAIGSADVIIDLEGYFAPATGGSTAGLFNPVAPVRICDTRSTSSSNQCNSGGNGTLAAGSTLTVSVNANGATPSTNVEAVVLNVTATNTTAAGGYLTIWANGQSQPTASNLNFGPNESIPNRVIVPVNSSNDEINIYNYSGHTDVIIDVNGWYTAGQTGSAGATFNAMTPFRICDTRSGSATNQCSGQAINSGTTLNVQFTGQYGIPTSAEAVILNVTVTNTTANGGYLTLYPSTSSQPTASDLNWSAGQTVPNLVIVELGTSGAVSVFNYSGNADLIIDVVGWYS